MNDREITRLIKPLTPSAAVTALLERCKLPATDLWSCASLQLFGIVDGTALQGMVGLEVYPPIALLRSLAVAPEMQGNGLGRTLVDFAEKQARTSGIETLYLLTTTAGPFFEHLGYARSQRDEAPASIRATAQFAGLRPSSSTFMVKRLTA